MHTGHTIVRIKIKACHITAVAIQERCLGAVKTRTVVVGRRFVLPDALDTGEGLLPVDYSPRLVTFREKNIGVGRVARDDVVATITLTVVIVTNSQRGPERTDLEDKRIIIREHRMKLLVDFVKHLSQTTRVNVRRVANKTMSGFSTSIPWQVCLRRDVLRHSMARPATSGSPPRPQGRQKDRDQEGSS